MPTDNTYVFLSHSHYDFDKVCRLRNLLEAEGFKPLMFFLKAFENPKFEPMLKPILKEEIDKIEEICQEAIKEITQEVKLPDTNLSLVGICVDKNNPNIGTVPGCGIYSKSQKDVFMLW